MNRKTSLFIAFFSLIFCNDISAQVYEDHQMELSSKKFDEQMDHFLIKSRNQKKIAWILLGG